MEMGLKPANKINNLETNCTLQLCYWHAAKAIKKQLIKEEYYINKRLELANLI